jgi:prefoldin subunit 5
MAIKNKAPGISLSGDLDILKTNTSRAIKELHRNILYLEGQNKELHERLDKLSEKPSTTEGEEQERTNTDEPTKAPGE